MKAGRRRDAVWAHEQYGRDLATAERIAVLREKLGRQDWSGPVHVLWPTAMSESWAGTEPEDVRRYWQRVAGWLDNPEPRRTPTQQHLRVDLGDGTGLRIDRYCLEHTDETCTCQPLAGRVLDLFDAARDLAPTRLIPMPDLSVRRG